MAELTEPEEQRETLVAITDEDTYSEVLSNEVRACAVSVNVGS
jgi:hypothetical protein